MAIVELVFNRVSLLVLLEILVTSKGRNGVDETILLSQRNSGLRYRYLVKRVVGRIHTGAWRITVLDNWRIRRADGGLAWCDGSSGRLELELRRRSSVMVDLTVQSEVLCRALFAARSNFSLLHFIGFFHCFLSVVGRLNLGPKGVL